MEHMFDDLIWFLVIACVICLAIGIGIGLLIG